MQCLATLGACTYEELGVFHFVFTRLCLVYGGGRFGVPSGGLVCSVHMSIETQLPAFCDCLHAYSSARKRAGMSICLHVGLYGLAM